MVHRQTAASIAAARSFPTSDKSMNIYLFIHIIRPTVDLYVQLDNLICEIGICIGPIIMIIRYLITKTTMSTVCDAGPALKQNSIQLCFNAGPPSATLLNIAIETTLGQRLVFAGHSPAKTRHCPMLFQCWSNIKTTSRLTSSVCWAQ